MQAFQKGQLDLALMSPTQSLPTGMNHVGLRRGDDATDAPYHHHHTTTTNTLSMQRSFSMDSALNAENHVQINGYENIIYEVESESEEQEFLRGDSDSEAGSAARARVVPKRKTQATTKRGRGRPPGPRTRKNIRENSMEVDIESEI